MVMGLPCKLRCSEAVWTPLQGCKERHLSQDYISWLLAAAADHFWAPLPQDPRKTASLPTAGATAPAAIDIRGSDSSVQEFPSIDEAAEATDRYKFVGQIALPCGRNSDQLQSQDHELPVRFKLISSALRYISHHSVLQGSGDCTGGC